MSAKKYQSAIHKMTEVVWGQGNLDVIAECYSPAIVRHQPPMPDVVGLDAYRQFVADIHVAYSDLRIVVDELIAEGDVTSIRGSLQGVHTGQSPTLGVPPTNKKVTLPFALICHWAEGKVTTEWIYADWLGLMQQLGVAPAMAEAAA